MSAEMVSAEEARAWVESIAAERERIDALVAADRRNGPGASAVRAELGDLDRCARTVVALRAIIEGRTTAPTRAEIAAHEAVGGRWLVRNPELVRGYVETSAEYTADACRVRGITLRWIALDADGRPCAWPEVPRVPCPACNARGVRLYGPETEDGCDDCEATGRVPAEVSR